jgi:hypothetical protein
MSLELGNATVGQLDHDGTFPAISGFGQLIRAAFSFPVFLSFALIALTALTIGNRFNDPDLWWHLKTGQVIWTTHSIPTSDVFSHTAAGHLWMPHEWLSELSLYGAYLAGGYSGLMFWFLSFASLLLVTLYGLSSLYSGNAKVSFLGGLIGWYFGSVGMTVRPLVIGHLLLVVELLLLQLGRTKDPRWFWGLPVVFALWVNCHASYAFGIFVLVVVVTCSFVDFKMGSIVSSAWDPPVHRRLVFASIAGVLALLLNPMGWRLLTYPLNTVFLRHNELLSYVDEWQPLAFLDYRAAGLLLILAGVVWAAARGIELRLEELILVLTAAAMAVQHQRMLFLFGIVAAPVVCRLLADCWEGYESKRDLPVANAVCIAIAIIVSVFSFPSASALAAQVRKKSPVGAVDYVRQAKLTGPMLNDYGVGGYLVWALPEHKVFVDGRGSDVFEWDTVLGPLGRWSYLEDDPQVLLDRYHIQFCVLDSHSPLDHVLPYLPGWHKAYGDQTASVFVREPR